DARSRRHEDHGWFHGRPRGGSRDVQFLCHFRLGGDAMTSNSNLRRFRSFKSPICTLAAAAALVLGAPGCALDGRGASPAGPEPPAVTARPLMLSVDTCGGIDDTAAIQAKLAVANEVALPPSATCVVTGLSTAADQW